MPRGERGADRITILRDGNRLLTERLADITPAQIVEGIVGIRRNRLTFIGEPDHAGTTPMAWRKDAFLAACEYALKAREHIVRKGSGPVPQDEASSADLGPVTAPAPR